MYEKEQHRDAAAAERDDEAIVLQERRKRIK